MKRLAIAIALAGALSSAAAAEYAPQEFDFSELGIDGVARGVVERVREVAIEAPQRDYFEHALKPFTADVLLIRIDNGRAMLLRPEQMQRFTPGQRVRLVSSTSGTRVEHE